MSNAEHRTYGPPPFQVGSNAEVTAKTVIVRDTANFGSQQNNAIGSMPQHSSEQTETKLVVIDSAVEGHAPLAGGIRGGYLLRVLDGAKNGLDELTRHLVSAAPVSELHIVSHGGAGEIRLGEAVLSGATFEDYADTLGAWKQAFGEGGEIHIYSCDVAADAAGADLIARLAAATGTAVAASTDRTGAAEMGGNWQLGMRLGGPVAGLPFTAEALQGFHGHLDASSGGNQNGTVSFLASELATAFAAAGYGSALNAIKVSWLSAEGSLTLNGQDVLPGQEIAYQDIDGLVFMPNADYDGSAEFGWVGHDGNEFVGETLASGSGSLEPAQNTVVVDESNDVVGDLGNQVWGDIQVSGTGSDGSDKLVTTNSTQAGLGVDGGRADNQIDVQVKTTYVVDDSGSNSGGGSGTPDTGGSNGVTFSNELAGVWIKAFQSTDGSWPDKLFNMADDPLVKGIVIVPNWYTLETGEGQYDWSSIYDAIGRAEAIGKTVTVTPYAQTFHTLADNPYTAGVPKYIVNDHKTYGGSPGHGGLEQQKDGSGWAVRRWDSEVMDRLTDMYKALVQEFDGHPSVPMLMFGPETSLKLNTPKIPDYSPEKYVAEYAELMREVAATAEHMELSMQMNWLPEWGNKGIQALYDVAKENGISVGSPDLMAAPKEMPYYDVFEAKEVPVDISVQMPSLRHVKSGVFSVEEMVQTGIDMGMRMMYVAAIDNNSSSATFEDVLHGIRNNPELYNWATQGLDPQLLAEWNDGAVEVASTQVASSNVVEVKTAISEELTFDFPDEVSQVTIQVARLQSDDAGVSGMQEVGVWKAFDADGDLVAEGLFVPDLGTAVSDTTFDFTINVGQPFDKLVVSAANYNNDADTLYSGENSDFSVTKITYSTVDPDAEPEPNEIPVVADATMSGLEDEAIAFTAADFQQAFSDADGDSLSMVKITSLPANGVLALNGSALSVGAEIAFGALDGLTFEPPAEWSGSVSFNWVGRDGSDYAKTAAAFTINVGAVNDAPVAVNDGTFDVAHNTAMVFDPEQLSGNDQDSDGDVLFVSSVGNATNGTVLLSVDTEVGTNGAFGPTIVFTPDEGYEGTASFEYVVADGSGGTATGTVDLQVAGAFEMPAPDAVTLVASHKTVTGTLGNQMWGDITISAEDWSGAAALVYVNNNGGLGVDGGRISNQIDFSVLDQDGDGVGGDSEKVFLDFPQAVDSVTLELSRMLSDELGGNVEVGTWQAFDANGDQVAVGLLHPAAAKGSGSKQHEFEISAGQPFTKLVVAAAHYNNDPSDSLVADNSDFSISKITYQPTSAVVANTAPIAIDDSGFATTEDAPLLLSAADLISNDVDLDLDLLLIESVGNASHGTVELVGDSVVFEPDSGYTGAAQFEYSITDGHGGTSTATVSLDVNPGDPVTLTAAKGSVTGEVGDQMWGDIKLSAKEWDGSEAPVILKWSGIGVGGGRTDFQIDFSAEDMDGDGVGGDSEQLILDFPNAVRNVSIGVGTLELDDSGGAGRTEIGQWQAFDGQGNLVGQGILDPNEGQHLNKSNYLFDLSDDVGAFSRLIVSATHYNNDSSDTDVTNNSDFMVRSISYTPAESSVVSVAGAEESGTEDISIVALDVGIGDNLLDGNGLDDGVQVL